MGTDPFRMISSARSRWGQTPRQRMKPGGRDQLAWHVGADVADDDVVRTGGRSYTATRDSRAVKARRGTG
jgi:hypothetical protein